MKKILFSVFVLFFVATTVGYAQRLTEKSSQKWVGGSLGFSTAKSGDDARTTNYKFLPEIGFQTSDRWGFGTSIGYQHTETAINADLKTKYNSFVIAPYARFTVYENDIVSIFTDGGVDYIYGKQSGSDVKSHAINVGLRPGVKVSISENFSFLARIGQLGYFSNSLKSDGGSIDSDSFKFDISGDQLLFGVNYVF